MTLFGDHAESARRRAVELVEQTIEALGVDAGQARVGSADEPRWVLRRGSASVVVSIHSPSDGAPAGTVRVLAPVVRLPDEGKQPALFRRLLEANAHELVGVAFGIREGDVVLVSERSLQDLDGSEIDSTVRTIGRVADRYDDALAREFGTSRSSD